MGDQIPNADLTDGAGVTVSVQTCTILVINVSFSVIVIPVDFAGGASQPFHTEATLAGL